MCLFCSEMAKGPHRIVWRRLDKHTSTTRVHTIESKQLQIRNFTAAEDNGIYTCALYSLPDNTLVDETQIELNLAEPGVDSSGSNRRNFHVNIAVQDRYHVVYGSNVKMTCSHDLDTTAFSLEWIRFNDVMPNNSHVNDHILTLYNVSKDNLGEYVCLITNTAGT